MTREVVLLALLLGIFSLGNAQDPSCGGIGMCGDCINTVGCVWCIDLNFTSSERCMPRAMYNASGCENVEPLDKGRVGTSTENALPNPISLKNINLNLAVGIPQTFPVRVTAVRNLPLDLYILMDLSSSMGIALNAVRRIAGNITQGLEDITNNVQLGFGSFNDKNTQPYTNFVGPESGEEIPYSFLHRIPFTANIDEFRALLENVRVTRNVDVPENGLEALAQVLTCEGTLGWRSRENTQVARLVLWMSDQGFHYAGEGVFGGILEPYREQCSLEPNAMNQLEYMLAEVYDYPSVGLVSRLVREQEVNVIFSVSDVYNATYTELANLIFGNRASVTRLTEGDGQDVLNTIREEYSRLLRDIFVRSTDATGQVSIEVTPTCPAGSMVSGDACTGVQLDESVEFSVSVTLNNCNNLRDGNFKVLTLDSGAFGTFTVNITGVCNCGCEDIQEENSPSCSGNGNFSCGVCVCNDGYCGPTCDLLRDTNSATLECPTGGPAFFNEQCSGRGSCNCVCDCFVAGVFGEACECDDFSEACMAPGEERVCSGRGTCCNRACMCQNSPLGNPYRGVGSAQFCQCEPEEEVCDYEGQLCNNRGDCLCDRCSCRGPWSGEFCEIPRAVSCNVQADHDCISMCRLLPGPPDYCTACNPNRPTLFVNENAINTNQDVVDYANRILGGGFRLVETAGIALECMSVIDGCTNEYYLLDNTTHNALVVIREVVCANTGELAIPIWSIAIIILGVLVILGILVIILVKIIFVILDYIEVKRWQKEAREADFSKNQNPLYQSPEMQYTNVAYGKAL